MSAGQCLGPELRWFHLKGCCEIECRPAELEYDSEGAVLLSRVPVTSFPGGSTTANDIWGFTSDSGREYAIVGLSQSTGLVEVTDPRAPVIVADVPDALSSWSDMKAYRGYVYNANERGGGIQIIDVRGIDEGNVTLVGSARGGVTTSHTLALDEVSGHLYANSTNLTRGIIAFDLSNPADPEPAGFWTEALAHDSLPVTYEECPYAGRAGRCEIVFVFAGGAGLKIVDATNKLQMQTIATLAYSTLAYAHQGWLSEDRRYLFIDDEFDEREFDLPTTTYVIEVTDLANPREVRTFTNGLCAIDHDLMARGSLLYEANYTSGLRVYDVGDIGSIRQIAYFDTYPTNSERSFNGAWGVYAGFPSGNVVVSDIQRGLFVVSVCPDERAVREDVDDDGTVGLGDFSLLQRCFGTDPRGGDCQPADLDCDRDIDLGDAALLTSRLRGAEP
jgi:choice-of-anchor B domain-containing protein